MRDSSDGCSGDHACLTCWISPIITPGSKPSRASSANETGTLPQGFSRPDQGLPTLEAYQAMSSRHAQVPVSVSISACIPTGLSLPIRAARADCSLHQTGGAQPCANDYSQHSSFLQSPDVQTGSMKNWNPPGYHSHAHDGTGVIPTVSGLV